MSKPEPLPPVDNPHVDSFQNRVIGMLKELHARKQQLDRAIAALAKLEVAQDEPSPQGAELPGGRAKRSKVAAVGRGRADT